MRFFAIKDIGDINFEALVKGLPGKPNWNPFSTQGQYITAILQSYGTLQKYGINNALRLSHFLAQGLIETGFLRYKAENLNYSEKGLLKIFPKYFTPEEAAKYARNPKKIANRVYANRMGNGDEASGDGWRYRGRGFFQLTGKDNYKRYGKMADVNLVKNPDILEKSLSTSVRVAAAFFDKTGLGEYADRNDAAAVSRGINRGNPDSRHKAHGEADRIIWTKKALMLVRNPDAIIGAASSGVAAASIAAGLDLGDRGQIVKDIQEKLQLLSYPVGNPDGIYGQNTRRAVLAFQDEHDLDKTGIVDVETADALEDALEDTRRSRPIERELATENDVRQSGARDIGKANEVGAAGAATSAGGAVAAANEVGIVEPVIEAVKDALTKDKTEETPVETTQTDDPIVPVETPIKTPTEPTDEPTTETPADQPKELPVEQPAVEPATAPEIIPDVIPENEPKIVPDVPPKTVPEETSTDGPAVIDVPETDETTLDTVPDVEIVPAETLPKIVTDTEADQEVVPETIPNIASEVTTGTEKPIPKAMPAEPETDMALMGILIGVTLIGLFIWARSRNIVDNKVQDYRDGRYL